MNPVACSRRTSSVSFDRNVKPLSPGKLSEVNVMLTQCKDAGAGGGVTAAVGSGVDGGTSASVGLGVGGEPTEVGDVVTFSVGSRVGGEPTEVGDVVTATVGDSVTAAVGAGVGGGLTFPGSIDGPGVGSPAVTFAVGGDVPVKELAGLCVGGHMAL